MKTAIGRSGEPQDIVDLILFTRPAKARSSTARTI
jgi:hypothetical protein